MIKDKQKLLAVLALIGVVITWGVSPIVSKYMLNSYSPGVKRLLDAIFATMALGLICNRQVTKIDRKVLKVSLFVGVCFALAMILEGVALAYTTPAKSSFFGNVTCITVPVFAALFAKMAPGIGKVLAGLICIAGFGVIIFGDGAIPSFSLGDALTLLSGVFYGATTAAIATWGKHMNSVVVTFLEFLVTIPFCAAYVFLFEEVQFSWNVRDILIIAVAAVLVQGVCWLLRNFAVRHLDAGLVAIVASFSTLVSGVVSIFAKMDVFSWNLVIGGSLCVGAAIVSGVAGKFERGVKRESAEEPITEDSV